jgi:hypothetical protein
MLQGALGRRPALPASTGGGRSEAERRLDDAQLRLKATIPPPED